MSLTLTMNEKWNNRALFRLLWPLLIEQILAVSMGTADTLMISSAGEASMSGINVVASINLLLQIAFIAMSTGGAVVCSQYIGRNDYTNSRIASRQLVYIVLLISVSISILAITFRRQVISLFFGVLENDVMEAAMTYFFFTALTYPMLAIYNAAAALFRSSGDSKTPMAVFVMIIALHIGGNAVFLYGFNFGAMGIGISNLISRTVAALLLLSLLIKKRDSPVSLTNLLKVKIYPEMAKRILKIGVPSGLEQSMFQFGRLVCQRIFPYFGTSIIAANAVATTLNSFAFMTANAFIIGLLTVVGQCMGARDYDAARKYTAKFIKMTWILISVVCGLTYIFRTNLISLFNLSPEAAIAANAYVIVHVITTSLTWTLSFSTPTSLRAAGDVKYVMIVGISSMWLIRVALSYVFAFWVGIGPIAVWIFQGFEFAARSAFFMHRWKSGRWQNIKVI